MVKQKVTVELDIRAQVDQAKRSIETITQQLNKISLPKGVTNDISRAVTSINKQIGIIDKQLELGQMDASGLEKVNNAFATIQTQSERLKEIFKDLKIDDKQFFPQESIDKINKAQEAIERFQNKNKETVAAWKEQLKSVNSEIKKLTNQTSKYNNDKNNKTINIVESDSEKEAIHEDWRKASANVTSVRNKYYAALNRLEKYEEAPENKDNLTQENAEYQALKKTVDDLKTSLSEVTAEREKLKNTYNSTYTKKEVADYEKLNKELEDTKQKQEGLQENINRGYDLTDFDQLKETIKNTGLVTNELGQNFDELESKVGTAIGEEGAKASEWLEKAAAGIEDLGNAANEAGPKIKTSYNLLSNSQEIADSVANLQQRLSALFSMNQLINTFIRSIKQAFTTVQELDKAMTETAVVSEETVSSMWNSIDDYTAVAMELGVTITDVIEAQTLFVQQGLDLDTSLGMATETMKMARIAGMDAATATDAMTAALRGFNLEVNQANAQKVNDIYSKIAAITASDTEELSTAMEKVASIANSANMSIENTTAFLAQIIETTRESAETAGTALKTVIARFSEVKELYSEGELTGTDEEGEEINVNNIQKALRTAGIDMTQFFLGNEGLDEVFMRLAEKWDSLTTLQQRYIATQAAGSRQQSRFIALMSDYQRTLELTEAAYNSAGASEEQFSKTQESLESKINKLKDAWNTFITGIVDSDLIKNGIDLITKILNKVNELTANSGLLKAGTVVAFFAAANKGLKTFNTMLATVVGSTTVLGKTLTSINVGNLFTEIKQKTVELVNANKAFSTYTELVGGATKAERTLNTVTELSTQATTLKTIAVGESTDATALANIATSTLGKSVLGETTTEELNAIATKLAAGEKLTEAEAATVSNAANKLLNATLIKQIALWMATPAGIITTVAVLALAGTAVLAYRTSLKYLQKQAEESAEAFSELKDELDELQDKLDSNIERIKELQELENPSFVDQEELDKLQQENILLRNQIALKKQAAEKAEKEASKDAKAVINSASTIFTNRLGTLEQYKKYAKYSGLTDEEFATAHMDEMGNFITDDEYQKLTKQQQNAYATSMEDYIANIEESAADILEQRDNLTDEDFESVKDIYESVYAFEQDQGITSITDYIDTLAAIGSTDKTYSEIQTELQDYFSKNGTSEISDEKITEIYGQSLIDKLAAQGYDLEQIKQDAKSIYDITYAINQLQSNQTEEWTKFSDLINAEDFEFDEANIKTAIDQSGLEISEDQIEDFIEYIENNHTIFLDVEINYEDAIDDLKSIEEGFDSISDAYQEFLEDGKISGSTLSGLKESFSEFGITNLDDILGEFLKADSITEVQTAVNNLATAFLNSDKVLQGLNESTKAEYTERLKALGVTNAAELVEQKYQQNKIAEIVANNTNAEVLESELDGYLKQIGATGAASQALKNYTAQQLLANKGGIQGIATNKSLQQTFINLVGSSSNAAKAITLVAEAYQMLDMAKKDTSGSGSKLYDENKSYFEKIGYSREQVIQEMTKYASTADYVQHLINLESVKLQDEIDKLTTADDTITVTVDTSVLGDVDTSDLEKVNDEYEWNYNLLNEINNLLEKRNELEEEYNRLLEYGQDLSGNELSNQAIIDNLNEQLEYYNQIIEKSNELKSGWHSRIISTSGTEDYLNGEVGTTGITYKELTKYISIDEEALTVKIDDDEQNKLLSLINNASTESEQEAYQNIYDAIQDAESEYNDIISEIQEANDNIASAKDSWNNQLKELRSSVSDFQQRVYDAIVDLKQKEIDNLSDINDSIDDANSKLIESMQNAISKTRQERDNADTEEDIADKQRRLAYLKQDTSGANQVAIKQLEKEIAEAQESYQDNLIDQKIDDMQDSLDAAAEQREEQIEILQAQLDYDEEHGVFWEETLSKIQDATENGLEESELLDILQKSESWEKLSAMGKEDWVKELQATITKVAGYDAVKDLTYSDSGSTNNDITSSNSNTNETDNKEASNKQGNITVISGNGSQHTGSYIDDNTIQYEAANGTYRVNVNDGIYDSNGNFNTQGSGYKIGLLNSLPDRLTTADHVRQLQNGLNAMLKAGVIQGDVSPVTGGYVKGDNTSKLVKKVQELVGMTGDELDGIWGPNTLKKFKASKYNYFKTGGLADYTGLAWLDGTPSKPEMVLNARDTENFIQLKDILGKVMTNTTSTTNTDNSTVQNYEINIDVAEMTSDYDVDEMASRIKKIIYNDSKYRNTTTVNRLR